MIRNSIDSYLEYLDIVLDNIPKIEDVLIKELINVSYSLINSKNILVDIQYIDYIVCYIFNKRYINYNMFLEVGKRLENIINGLKTYNSF